MNAGAGLAVCCATVTLLLLSSCAAGHDRTPPFLFILNPALVSGVHRPSAPTDLKYQYDPTLKSVHLTWAPSIDPDTNSPTPTYRVYLYLVYPPASFYRADDLVAEPITTEVWIDTAKYTGGLTFVVTGYDGLAESLPSSPLNVTIP